MRKMKPRDVKDDFSASLQGIKVFHDTVSIELSETDKSISAENSFLAAAVLWEGFISDLIIAYINRDSSEFSNHLLRSFESALSNPKHNLFYKRFVKLTLPKNLTKKDILAFLDPEGSNITFSNYADFEDGAHKWLTPASCTGINSQSAEVRSTVNVIIAIRNHIAHRSERSFNTMNDLLNKGGLYNTGLKRNKYNVRNVGAYLKATPAGKTTSRLDIFLTQMTSIASTL